MLQAQGPSVVVQPPLTAGNPRTSQRCALAGTAGAVSCCAANGEGLAPSLPLYRSSELGPSGAPWPHLNLLMPGVAPAWSTSELCILGTAGIV